MNVTTESSRLLDSNDDNVEDFNGAGDINSIFDVLPSLDKTPLEVHILSVSFFLIFGLLANVAVIYLFTSKKNNSGNVYMVALAVLDIMACVLLCPQFPFLQFYDLYSILAFFYLLDSVMLTYMYILAAMSLSRFCAVMFPITYKMTRHRHKYFVITIFIVGFGVFAILSVLGQIETWEAVTIIGSILLIGGSTVISFLSMFVTYSLIIKRLFNEGQNLRQGQQGEVFTVTRYF